MIYDTFAKDFAIEYELFLMALSGIYQSKITAGVKVSSLAVSEIKRESHNLATAFLERSIERLDNQIKGYVESASGPIHDDAIESIDARRQEAVKTLQSALSENIIQVLRQMRRGGTDYSSLTKDEHGGIGYLIQNRVGKIKFVLVDSIGRKYEAVQFLRSAMRDAMYQIWIDVQIGQIKASEENTFLAVNQDPEKNVKFSFTETEGMTTFNQENRKRAFHPNSTMIILRMAN